MADYTIGDLGDELEDLLRRLKRISDKLKTFDQDRAIDKNPGWKPVCHLPVFAGPGCVKPEPPVGDFQVKDLVEGIEGLKEWTNSVKSRVSKCDSATKLGTTTGPRLKDIG